MYLYEYMYSAYNSKKTAIQGVRVLMRRTMQTTGANSGVIYHQVNGNRATRIHRELCRNHEYTPCLRHTHTQDAARGIHRERGGRGWV